MSFCKGWGWEGRGECEIRSEFTRGDAAGWHACSDVRHADAFKATDGLAGLQSSVERHALGVDQPIASLGTWGALHAEHRAQIYSTRPSETH